MVDLRVGHGAPNLAQTGPTIASLPGAAGRAARKGGGHECFGGADGECGDAGVQPANLGRLGKNVGANRVQVLIPVTRDLGRVRVL